MKLSVNKLTKIAILSALSFIIMLFEFPLPLMPAFLKIDLSEIPALLAAFSMGPVSAVLVELLKNLLHLLKTSTSGIGELANFLVGVAYVLPAAIIYKFNKTKKGALIALGVSTISLVAFASVFNYFVLLPLYSKILNFPMTAIIQMGAEANKRIVDMRTFIAYAIVPFNFIKGIVVSAVVLLIYKKLSPILHK